ncbi:MAG: LptF/LptG family permease [Firmicutes bacterium]|nr:LptF/LptG family permease [Bacillota bacterium]
MRILDRYFFSEVIGPFVLALTVIIILMISGVLFELSDLLISKRVPLSVILRLFSYQLPWATVEALPIAVLAAVLIVTGRLAAENELTIIRSVGVSLKRYLVPALIFALAISILSYYLSEEVLPQANHAFQNTVRRIVLKDASPEIEEDVFFRAGKEYFFYIGQVDPASLEMRQIMVYQLRQEGYPRLITAASGYIRDGSWHLTDGVMRDIGEDGFVSDEVKYSSLTLELGDGLEHFFANQKTTREMTRAELLENIHLFAESGVNLRPFIVDYHLKLASPLASLVFVLFCLPLALRFLRLPRYSRFLALAASVALTLSYYLLTPFCRSLGINGIIPAVLGAWLPVLFLGSVGTLLYTRLDSF